MYSFNRYFYLLAYIPLGLSAGGIEELTGGFRYDPMEAYITSTGKSIDVNASIQPSNAHIRESGFNSKISWLKSAVIRVPTTVPLDDNVMNTFAIKGIDVNNLGLKQTPKGTFYLYELICKHRGEVDVPWTVQNSSPDDVITRTGREWLPLTESCNTDSSITLTWADEGTNNRIKTCPGTHQESPSSARPKSGGQSSQNGETAGQPSKTPAAGNESHGAGTPNRNDGNDDNDGNKDKEKSNGAEASNDDEQPTSDDTVSDEVLAAWLLDYQQDDDNSLEQILGNVASGELSTIIQTQFYTIIPSQITSWREFLTELKKSGIDGAKYFIRQLTPHQKEKLRNTIVPEEAVDLRNPPTQALQRNKGSRVSKWLKKKNPFRKKPSKYAKASSTEIDDPAQEDSPQTDTTSNIKPANSQSSIVTTPATTSRHSKVITPQPGASHSEAAGGVNDRSLAQIVVQTFLRPVRNLVKRIWGSNRSENSGSSGNKEGIANPTHSVFSRQNSAEPSSHAEDAKAEDEPPVSTAESTSPPSDSELSTTGKHGIKAHQD